VLVSERLLNLASERRLPSRIEPDDVVEEVVGTEPPPATAWLSSRVDALADNCRSSGAAAGVEWDVGRG
jgi:hypothetical protein